MAAAVVEHRGAVAAMDGHAVPLVTTRAGQPRGVQPLEDLGIAGVLVQQISDGEVHGRLRNGEISRDTTEYACPEDRL